MSLKFRPKNFFRTHFLSHNNGQNSIHILQTKICTNAKQFLDKIYKINGTEKKYKHLFFIYLYLALFKFCR
jgi:hypothetical protein